MANRSDYAYVPDENEPSTWKLNISDAAHVGGAVAALGKGYRGEKVQLPASARAGVIARVRAAWKKFHPGEELPSVLQASEIDPDADLDDDMLPIGDPDHDMKMADGLEADEPNVGDLHIDAPVNSEKPRQPQSGMKRLYSLVRDYMRAGQPMTDTALDTMYRSARGHSGGKASHASESLIAFEPPEWMPVLPKPGTYAHPSYGELALTSERVGNFVRNFNGGVYQSQVPVDAEHQSKLSGALGWIKELRQNADGSADARVDWTDRGRALAEADAFKYVSPEWYDRWCDPATSVEHRDVLIGAAMTTRPFFKDGSLRPLAASEAAGWAIDLETTVIREGDTLVDPKTMSEEQARQFAEVQTKLAATETKLAATETTLAEAKTFGETQAQAAQQLSERVAVMERTEYRREFAELAKTFADPTSAVDVLEQLATTAGRESEVFKSYVESQTTLAKTIKQAEAARDEAQRSAGLFKETGRDGSGSDTSVEARVEAAVTKTMAEHNLTRGEAVTRVFNEQPNLYSEHVVSTRLPA